MPHDLYDTKPILALVISATTKEKHRQSILRFQRWLHKTNYQTITAQSFLEYTAVNKHNDLLYALKYGLEDEVGKDAVILQPLRLAIVDKRRQYNNLRMITDIISLLGGSHFCVKVKFIVSQLQRLIVLTCFSHGIAQME